MKAMSMILTFFAVFALKAQDNIQYTQKQFFAISVPNTETTSKWYEEVFDLKLLKEIKPVDRKVHIRILGNEHLMVEIIQDDKSRTLTDCGLERNQSRAFTQGFFKTGFYVKDLLKAKEYFQSKNVIIKHGPFDDEETSSNAFIIEDINGFLLQVLEERK